MRQDSKVGSIERGALWGIASLALLLSSITLTYDLVVKRDRVVAMDAAKVYSKYKGVEAARKALEVKKNALKANLDTLRRELQASIDDYKNNKAKSTKRELKLMEEALQSKQRNLSNYEQAVKDQTTKLENESATRILTKINDFVRRYGKKRGYTVILAATQLGNVAYADETVDITDEVLSGLNSEY